MSITLETICAHCKRPVSTHAIDREGAWLVRPCNAQLLAMTFSDGTSAADRWALMALDDADACRFCCQPLAGHFQLWHPTIGIVHPESLRTIATVSAPDPQPGEIVIMRPRAWIDCRTAQQKKLRPKLLPRPPACHEDGSPFGYKNPWAC